LLAPDHLDWHGTYERYVSDKLNLFGHRADIELAVNARSAEATAAAGGITAGERLHLYGADGPVQVVRNGGYGLLVDGAEVPGLSGLPLRGRHNFDNLCGAITATRILTGSLPDFSNLAGLIAEMPVLPGRLTTFAMAGGVEFVDDALASNPAGAIAALEAFEGRRVSLIAGGHVRGTEFRLLAEALEAKNAADGATLVHLGDAGRRLVDELEAISSQVPRLSAKDMAQAVTLAATAVSGTGGVVLFSPGAPTPPSEGTYVERGAEFRRAVELVVAPIAERDLAGTC
jgi:UDP-N-acetylmuramoylalanine--D-glutamate ligase